MLHRRWTVFDRKQVRFGSGLLNAPARVPRSHPYRQALTTLLSARMSQTSGLHSAMGQTVSARYRHTFNTPRTLAASHWQVRRAFTVWCARLQAARQESTAAHPEYQFVGAGPEHAAAKPCITAQAGMSSPLVRIQHRARRTSHQVSKLHRPRPPLNGCLPQNIPNRKHRCCRCWFVSLACR